MPLVFKPDQLREGMTLASSIRRGPTLLLPEGHTLSARDIAALKSKHPHGWARVSSPGLDAAVVFEDDSRDRERAEAAMTRVAACMDQAMANQPRSAQGASGGRSSRKASGGEYGELEQSVRDVIAYMVANPVGRVLPKLPYAPDSYLADHIAQVFYLSMRLGTAARAYVVRERVRQTHARDLPHVMAQSLLPMGLGVLYMDMAMAELAHLESHTGALTPADRRGIEQHPDRAADLLPQRFPASARALIRTHHRNLDGTGYPAPPQGFDPAKLHVFTRIVRICDTFDAAITPRAFRAPKSAVRILWEMARGPLAPRYDPHLMGAFTEMVQPLPIGARLKLTDGTTAVVCGTGAHAFAPRVTVAFDTRGKLLLPRDMQAPFILDGSDGRRIAAAEGEDLSYLYTTPAPAAAESAA